MSHTDGISFFPLGLKIPRQKPIYTIQVRPDLNLYGSHGWHTLGTGSSSACYFYFLFYFTDDQKRMEKGVILVISSSNVGMESARTYRSSTTRTLSFSAKTTLYSLADNKNALGNQDLLGSNSEDLETNQENTTAEGEKANSATDAMERLKGSSATGINRIQQIAEG